MNWSDEIGRDIRKHVDSCPVFVAFIPGNPVAQPRDVPSVILPPIAKFAEQLPRYPIVCNEQVARGIWHWFRKNARAGTRGVDRRRDKPHPVKKWRETVRAHVEIAIRQSGIKRYSGPLSLELTFILPRPKSKIRKTKPNPNYWRDQTPDGDNLSKAVLDALNGVLWDDDRMIAELVVRKEVAGDGDLAGLGLRLRQLPPQVHRFDYLADLIATAVEQQAKPF